MSKQIQARNQGEKSLSGKWRFGVIVALCLAALYTVLFFWHIQMQQMITAIMKFIGNSKGMSVMVFLLIIVGGVMFVKSLLRIKSELSVLEERCNNPQHLGKNANPEDCYEWLKEKEGDERHSLLYCRLDVLLAEHGNVRGEKKLPSMSDLHEITLHRELSNWDSAGLNTIISFLLILGILGTLTGVHGVLAADDYELLYADKYGIKLLKLAPALSPSAFAVLGTVLLMICRAWYLRFVDSYLGLLDEVTMKSILPGLSQKKELVDPDIWKILIQKLKDMEALDVPKFSDDAGRVERWKVVKEARKNATAQVAQLDELKKTAAPEAPLPPNPPTQFLVRRAVLTRLSMERIMQGERLCELNKRKLNN